MSNFFDEQIKQKPSFRPKTTPTLNMLKSLMLKILYLFALVFIFLLNNSLLAEEKIDDLQLKLKNFFEVMPSEMKSFDEFTNPGVVYPDPPEMEAVIKIGKPVVPELIKHLRDKDRYASESAQYALVLLTNKQFNRSSILQWELWWNTNKIKSRVQWFIDDLNSSDFQTRKDAVIRLGEMDDKKLCQP